MPTPPVKPEDVQTKLEACGASTDASSMRINAAIIADNVNNGAQGAGIVGAARISANVGQCVADAYETNKKPAGLMDRASSWASGLTERFSAAANEASVAVNNLAIKPGQGPRSVGVYNNTVAKLPEQKL